MRFHAWVWSIGLLFFSIQHSFCQNWPSDHVPGDFLLKLQEGAELESTFLSFKTHAGPLPISEFEQLNRRLNLWRIHMDVNQVEEEAVLGLIRRLPEVDLAQFNHWIHDRSVPNDPFFENQWHHDQSADHDIDTPEAWNLTTGGTTTDGHRVVVAVLETGGSNYNHTDLIGNHWVNAGEVDGNGIDDDGNGYIDDVHGWNSGTGNDNISAGGHGTAVSGMIGGVGNNGTGGGGVNWDVEIMQIQLASLTEAAVIAAYSYAYDMRQLYNETNGEEGAFVVVTNASWGIDGAAPGSFPLWCGFYDDLGEVGILNCGATANNNVNVDVVGDMPTGCSSPYMVAVTATNSNDIRTFSGYGVNSIDLAAPGEAVYLPTGANAYASTSGTSFASPCVAGAIALLYAAPCTGFGEEALDDPQGVADWVRSAILEGIDPVDGLSDQVSTGGRLNVRQSLDILLDGCAAFTGFGCTDGEACNFNPDAIEDDGSCTTEDACGVCGGNDVSCTGCTEAEACNYDADALLDDGSCVLPTTETPCSCETEIEWSAALAAGATNDYAIGLTGTLESFEIEVTFNNANAAGAWAADLVLLIEAPNGACFEIGGYNMTLGCAATGNFPSTWNSSTSANYYASFAPSNDLFGAGIWTFTAMNGWSASGVASYDIEIELYGPCEIPVVIPGCMDPEACNFNPQANISDGTCEYQACANAGCTYDAAENFNPAATYDDGTCIFLGCDDPCPADINGNGVVTAGDLLLLLAAFGDPCP